MGLALGARGITGFQIALQRLDFRLEDIRDHRRAALRILPSLRVVALLRGADGGLVRGGLRGARLLIRARRGGLGVVVLGLGLLDARGVRRFLAGDGPIIAVLLEDRDGVVDARDAEGVAGVEGVPPVRAALTFAIVALSAPNEERSERIDEICEAVRVAACAIGASESIDVAIASPVATAAIFAVAFIVTICITIVNFLGAHE